MKKQLSVLEQTWWLVAMLLFGLSSLLKQTTLLYISTTLLVSFFFYRMYTEWKAGDQKAVRVRLIWLAVALVAGSLAYWYCSR